MSGAVYERTPNLGLGLLEFNFPNWGDDANQNTKIIDAGFSVIGVAVKGAWANSTQYSKGDLVVDTDNNSLWRCQIDHQSAASGTFEQDRAAHPTYWADASGALHARGLYTTATVYYTNDVTYATVNKYAWAMATLQFTSTNWAADVAAGKLVIITDSTQVVADATAAKNAAQASATAASGSATSASTSATNAGNSATAAAGSATGAATSATNAGNSATAAAASAVSAQGYAANALTYSNNASTFATNSQNSATAAAASAAQAQALYNAMLPDAASDGKTYGRKNATWSEVASQSFPDAPANGNTYGRKNNAWAVVIGGASISDTPPASPVVGQLWFESTTGSLFIYYFDGDSNQWVQINTTSA